MTTTIKLDGLHCGACVNSVKNALEALDSVTKAEVTLDPQQAVVEGSATVEELIGTITEIGFEASV